MAFVAAVAGLSACASAQEAGWYHGDSSAFVPEWMKAFLFSMNGVVDD